MARASASPESPASPVRGTVRIPGDQAALLGKSDSWIASLKASNHPLGLINLPGSVLGSLTKFHRERLQNPPVSTETEGSRKRDVQEDFGEPQENAGGKDSTPPCTTPRAGATDPATPTEERALAVNHGSGDSNQKPGTSSPPGTLIPWTPSPNRDTAKSAERSSSPDVPETRSQPQLPSSSLELEEELEIVTPRGMRDPAGPTNLGAARHLSPSPTPGYTSSRPPPCGQGDRHLIDPDFDEEAEEDMQADSESTDRARDVPGRRSRRMQDPVFPSVIPQKTSHFGNRHATAKMQSAPRVSMLDSSQASFSSIDPRVSPAGDIPISPWEASGPGKRRSPHTPNPDLVDETSSKRVRTIYSDAKHEGSARGQTLPPASRRGTTQPPTEDPPTSASEALGPQQRIRQRPDPGLHQPSSMRPRTPGGDTYHEDLARQEIQVSTVPLGQAVRHHKPFDAYREAYPEYHGSLIDFISACISLEYIQRQDLMRDLLYDDFIHAWVEGYVVYVARYGDGALPANKWFNRLGGRVELDKMIITRKNLHLVPEAYPGAYPKEYREELRAPKLSQSPERSATSSRALAQSVRPGSAQEAIPPFRQAMPNPEGQHLDQNTRATSLQPSRVAPEVQMPRAGIPSSQHSRAIRDGSSEISASSQPPLVIPATQTPTPTALDQRSRSESAQRPYHHSNGERPIYPQTQNSVIAESPFKRIVTPKEQVRHSMPPPRHPYNEVTLQQDIVSEERPRPLSLSTITHTSMAPVTVRNKSDNEDFSPTRPTAQASEEARISPTRQNRDDRLGSPSTPGGMPDVGGSNGDLTGHDVPSSGRPSSNVRPEGSKAKHAGTSNRSFERRVRSPDQHSSATSDGGFERSRVRSPDLHSSAYASPSPPRRNDSDNDGQNNANPVAAKDQHAEAYTGPGAREKESRGTRHSIATGNPRASSGNDKITRVIYGRVHKDTGRKSAGSEGGRGGSEKKKGDKKNKKKKRRVTMEEALEEFMRKKRAAEEAAASPASGL